VSGLFHGSACPHDGGTCPRVDVGGIGPHVSGGTAGLQGSVGSDSILFDGKIHGLGLAAGARVVGD
jgi:hypothetical protein